VAAKGERKDAIDEQYVVRDRNPYHRRRYKRQLHDAHEVRAQMGLGEHLARLDSFRARGSAPCGRPRDHPESVNGLPLSDAGNNSLVLMDADVRRGFRGELHHVRYGSELLRIRSGETGVDLRKEA